MVKTPAGVLRPFVPLLILEYAMRRPLRYALSVWSGKLITTTSGPLGEISGSQKNSPARSWSASAVKEKRAKRGPRLTKQEFSSSSMMTSG